MVMLGAKGISRFGLRPSTQRAVTFYWLAWLVVVAFDVATQLQDGYRFWQLSPYTWWVAPLVLWWTCPRSTQRVWLALPLLVLSWADARIHDFMFEAMGTWDAFPGSSSIPLVRLLLKALLVGLVSAVLFARPLAWVGGALATRAAVVVGISVACADYYYKLSDLDRWDTEPLVNALRILNAALMVSLLAFAAECARRGSEGSADARASDAAKASTMPPRFAGFGSSVIAAFVTVLVTWHAWESIDDPWIAVSVAVVGWTFALGLVTYSGVRAWRRLGTGEWTSTRWRKGIALSGRGGILAAAVPIWVCMIWTVAPPAGWEVVQLSRNLPGPTWAIGVEPSGKTLIIDGGLEPGIATAARAALRSHPSVEYVELNSPGGFVSEGELLAESIQSRGLVTFVREECSSACVRALAAGRERWLASGALVGLHAPSSLGLPTTADAADESSFFRTQGVAEGIARRGAEVPFWDIWYPTEKELLDSGLVTRVVSEEEFEDMGAP